MINHDKSEIPFQSTIMLIASHHKIITSISIESIPYQTLAWKSITECAACLGRSSRPVSAGCTLGAPMWFFSPRHHCARVKWVLPRWSKSASKLQFLKATICQPGICSVICDIWRFFKFGPCECASSAAGCEQSCNCSMCLMEQDISPLASANVPCGSCRCQKNAGGESSSRFLIPP